MNANLRTLALATMSTLALTALPAFGSGNVDVINESPVVIHPWFKSNCWGYYFAPGTTGWVFFGGIGANGGRFGWGFNDPGMIDPACPNPIVEFTYTTDFTPPPDPQKGNRRAATHFSPDQNTVFQIGKSLYAKELAGPDDTGR